jgi:hypothetical protein
MYLYLETEEDYSSDHSENDDEETRTAEYLEKKGLKLDEYGQIVEDVESRTVAVICSCGYYTCGAIERFGHPLPVFQEDIEPLFPQHSRDKRALELKGLS